VQVESGLNQGKNGKGNKVRWPQSKAWRRVQQVEGQADKEGDTIVSRLFEFLKKQAAETANM
jgi:hypothetical protein